jgi:ankyrin repeat protein
MYASASRDLQARCKCNCKNSRTYAETSRFLLVRLNFESLLELLNPNELRDTLSKLPTGWDAYDTAYKTILSRIESRGPRHEGLAKKALSWTVYSKRPLETTELQHALAIGTKESAFDHGNLVTIEDLISLCAGLLHIDESSKSIRLIHATAQEFLERTHNSWASETPSSLTDTCITYLSYDTIEEHLSGFEGELPKTLLSHPFYNYAAENWVSHATQCREIYALKPQSFKLCQRFSNTCMLWFAQRRLQTEVEWLLEQGFAGEVHDGEFKTPLHYAVLNGWVKCVRSLLQNGATLKPDHNNMTALHYSVAEGNTEMVQAILEAKIFVDIPVQRRIWYCTWSDVQEGSRRVWERQHDPEPPIAGENSGEGLTALHYAALTGSATMTRLLLDYGADPNALSEYGETPLQLAIRKDVWGHTWTSGNEDYWNDPRFMIEYSLDLIDLVDEEEFTLVQIDVEETRFAVIDALLRHPSVDYTKQDCFGTSLLHCVRYGSGTSRRVLEELLTRDVRVDLHDSKGRTALHLACLEKDLEAIRMLLDSGANILVRDDNGSNAFHFAARSGSLDSLQLILQSALAENMQGIAQSRDGSGRNALHLLLEERGKFVTLDVVQYLVDVGVHVNDLDDHGFSPLARFMERFPDRSSHKAEIAEYLFSNGADAGFVTPDGLNLGHLAAAADEVGCALLRAFVRNGVNLESQDDKDRTILHHCALHGSLETDEALDFLCNDVGLSLDSADTDGMTPSQISAAMRSERRHPMLFRSDRWDLAEELLRRGKEKEMRSDSPASQVIIWNYGKISLAET